MERKSEMRRKIAERGFERIAFITSVHRNNIEDSSSLHLLQAKASSSDRHESVGDEFSRDTTSDLGSEEVPRLSKCSADGEARCFPLVDVEDTLPLSPIRSKNKLPSSPMMSRIHKVSSCRNHSLKQYGINPYSPKELNFCIIASESTRISCSVVIALIVVLSNINLTHNIVKSRSFIASNPLYVLLLTDVAIVLGWLTVNRIRFSKIKEEVNFKEGKSIWGGAFSILEFGLVAHQTIRAIFIDFSFYVVIVICGLSLM